MEHNGNFKYDTFDGHTRFTIEIPKVQNAEVQKAA